MWAAHSLLFSTTFLWLCHRHRHSFWSGLLPLLSRQDSSEACYKTRLRIQAAGPSDEREYLVIVENQLGSDRHALALQVKGQPV